MRQVVASLSLLVLGSCSLIYNPSNITKTDAGHDAPVDMKPGPKDAPEVVADANAAALMLTTVEPVQILEGQGAGGSRKAVVVVHGMNIVPGATISIAPKNAGDMPMVTSMAGAEVIGADHNFIAVPVTAAVNASCDTATLPLTITVTQGATTSTIDWQLACLPQVNQSTDLALSTAQPNVYSELVLTGTAKLTASNTTAPLIVRATADLSVAAAIDVSAAAQAAGPGGAAGGATTHMGGGAGGGAAGGGLTQSAGGGGAGYHDKGTDGSGSITGGPMQGDPPMTGGYAANFASGGGGADSVGGGGGGTLELTAGGTLTAHAITSKGGGGATSTLGSGGGGGAGGTVVLRGASVSLTTIDVSAGAGASGGGAGSPGRIRIDAPAVTGTVPAAAYAGFSIDPSTPYVTSSPMPTITLHGTAGARYDVFTLDQAGNVKDEDDNKLLGSASGQLMPQVHWGWNKVCVTPHSATASPTVAETASCVEIAFLP